MPKIKPIPKRKRKPRLFSEITGRREFKEGYKGYKDVETIRKIMKLYFQMILETVFAGFSFEIPYNIGTIAIYKNKITNINAVHASRYETIKTGVRKIAINPIRIGYYYSIELTSKFLTEAKMKFKAGRTFRQKLSNILVHTNQEYRSK